ncbi:single-stranded-DNA-specific exonuclease RecJ [Acetobacteraceae bacterium]|nr:single-stranded-DNA-specific exonuclease RecJ [Candidatus Parcubacteria bacterium]
MQKIYRLRPREHDELIVDLLAARGVTGEKERKSFLEPDYMGDSHDPFLLPDMEKAVERILTALENNEKVCVWSDYDCDGIPGGVMLSEFLRSIGAEVRHYIPHRHKEGYGLNSEGIDELAGEGVKLIITIDLGTTEFEGTLHAKKKGIDIIVTDHHEPPAELPDAFAIINPKRVGSAYPFTGLCGAGVAWKLVQALLMKNRFGFEEGKEKWFLDLVGLATLSDMVPLIGENRMLARFGLVVMRRGRRPGLAALLNLLRIKASTLTEDDVGFMVSPRINAASRMDSPEIAAALLGATNVERAADLARQLNHINDERKGVVASIAKEANKRLKESGLVESSVIVMGNPNWRPGVLGLVANTLATAHGKPVFLWGREGGDVIRGSVRSPSVSVVELMSATNNVFNEFGGHHASGGFSVSEENVHGLGAELERAYKTLAAKGLLQEETLVDRELALAEIPFALRDLEKLAPFGVGNQKPLFMFPGISVSSVRSFGKGGDHIEAQLSDTAGSTSAGMSFFSTPDSFQKKLERGAKADIVGHVELDWRGKPRIRIVDAI